MIEMDGRRCIWRQSVEMRRSCVCCLKKVHQTFQFSRTPRVQWLALQTHKEWHIHVCKGLRQLIDYFACKENNWRKNEQISAMYVRASGLPLRISCLRPPSARTCSVKGILDTGTRLSNLTLRPGHYRLQ